MTGNKKKEKQLKGGKIGGKIGETKRNWLREIKRNGLEIKEENREKEKENSVN